MAKKTGVKKENDNRNYKYAFFSAFSTIPGFSNVRDFFEKDIKASIFDRYKEGLKTMSLKAGITHPTDTTDPKNDILYKPVPYWILGDFDLALFSLIDDFSFSSRKFKPAIDGTNFKYQVNTGVIPLVDVYKKPDKNDPASTVKKNRKVDKFETNVLPGFFSGESFYPFTGITSVKLNNSMMIGVGREFVETITEFLVARIDRYIQEKEGDIGEKGIKMFFIINENLGWNEISIYFFSNSITAIAEIASVIRRVNLNDVFSEPDELGPEFDTYRLKKNNKGIERLLNDDSLLGQFIKNGSDSEKKCNIRNSHPIVASSTVFGFHIDLLTSIANGEYKPGKVNLQPDELIMLKKELETKCITMYWNIKPGHEYNANQIIQKIVPYNQQGSNKEDIFLNTESGKYSFKFPGHPLSVLGYLEILININRNKNTNLKFRHNIIKFRSKISFPSATWGYEQTRFDEDSHYFYSLDKYKIDLTLFKEIRTKLRLFTVPHIIKSQIENLIFNFNDAIGDHLMYSYFIGLREPLIQFLKDKLMVNVPSDKPFSDEGILKGPGIKAVISRSGQVEEPETNTILLKDSSNRQTPEVKSADIVAFVETWNKAYWNRYFHSYYFTEINDFNIEHHGGIQQILFSYDMIYKVLSRRLYRAFSREPFVNVRVAYMITSSPYTNTINFTHLFRPAIYACECVHEVANHVVQYLVKDLGNVEYKLLFNAQSDAIDQPNVLWTEDLEKRVVETMNIMDREEMNFIHNFFGLNLLRYLFTDYVSYKIAYENTEPDKENNIQKPAVVGNLIRFYHTHWFLLLAKSDHYVQEKIGDEGKCWYFRETDIEFLFVRFNLMFYMMMDMSEADLKKINLDCPSVELNVFWNSKKDFWIKFVVELGENLKTCINKKLAENSDPVPEIVGDDIAVNKPIKNIPGGNTGSSPSLESFKRLLNTEVISISKEATETEKLVFEEVRKLNYNLISKFHDFFKVETGENNRGNLNIIKRHSSQQKETIKNMEESNISFYKFHEVGDGLFLDPKGNVFSVKAKTRENLLYMNIGYLQDIWNLSMKYAKDWYF